MVVRWPDPIDVDVGFDPEADIEFPVREVDGCAVVVACGEIDVCTSPALRCSVDAAVCSSRRVIIDLSDVTFLDSSGLAALLHARTQAPQHGPVALVGAAPIVRRVLDVAGLSGQFHLCDSVDDAAAPVV